MGNFSGRTFPHICNMALASTDRYPRFALEIQVLRTAKPALFLALLLVQPLNIFPPRPPSTFTSTPLSYHPLTSFQHHFPLFPTLLSQCSYQSSFAASCPSSGCEDQPAAPAPPTSPSWAPASTAPISGASTTAPAPPVPASEVATTTPLHPVRTPSLRQHLQVALTLRPLTCGPNSGAQFYSEAQDQQLVYAPPLVRPYSENVNLLTLNCGLGTVISSSYVIKNTRGKKLTKEYKMNLVGCQ